MTNLIDAIREINSLEYLKAIIENYGYKFEKDKEGYKTKCPFHDEKTPSFRLQDKGTKGAYYHCFGCNSHGDIANFMQNIDSVSLFEATKKAYEILGIPFKVKPSKIDSFLNFIEGNSKKNPFKLNDIIYNYENSYIYHDAENKPLYLKHKYRNTIDKSKKHYITKALIETEKGFKSGTEEEFEKTTKVIYNLSRVKASIDKGKYIYFVEGEKDADNLNRLGFTATTIYTKTNKFPNSYKEQLAKAKIVFIGDTGAAGEKFKNLVWENLKNVVQSFKVVTLTDIESLGDNKDITDWLEAGHTKEELKNCIKDAHDWKISTKWKDVSVIEKKDGKKEIKPLKTIDNMKLILERTKTKVFWNEITKVLQIETNFFNNKTTDTFITELQSYCIKDGFKCTLADVRSWIEVISHERSINPFKVWMDNIQPWDGKSRIEEYLNNFTVVSGFDENLKNILFTKWLLSFAGSVYDPNYKAYGFLVMKGGQGIGKGECFKRLIPIKEDWVFLGEQEYKGDRDNIQTLTSNLLVEFSEFARSTKKVNELKGFVTTDKDKLSLKYDKYTTTNKRNTIYFATVNDAHFLVDDDNRRMWVIDLEKINWEGINNFDYVQLWAEIKETYLANPIIEGQPCYHLLPSEKEILNVSNRNYNYKTEIETTLEALLNFDGTKRIWLRSAEIVYILDIKASEAIITKALKKLGETTGQDKYFGSNARGKFSTCPLPKSWHGEVNSKYKDRLVTDISIISPEKLKEVKDSTDLKSENKKLKEMIKLLQKQVKENNFIINQQQLKIVELENDNKTWEEYFKAIDKEA